jgi:gentisate 1,2-dioxygenase
MDGTVSNSDQAARASVEARARYYSPANIFKVERPPIPAMAFVAARDQAMAPDAPTGWVPLDIGTQIGLDEPATTPLMLARYARVAPGESLTGAFRASGEFYFVISGDGRATKGDESFAWESGDVFSLPGGGETRLDGGIEGAVLLLVTNEPELAFHGLEPPAPQTALTAAVRYPMADILAEMDRVRADQSADPNASGRALHLTSDRGGKADAAHPSIKLAMNTLDPHSIQRSHRHNSVALTLPITADNVYSMIEGNRLDWHPYALMITPPAELHGHHNEGDTPMLSLVIQDGGLYFRCRTIGFSFD